jgi:hypothetical protein
MVELATSDITGSGAAYKNLFAIGLRNRYEHGA